MGQHQTEPATTVPRRSRRFLPFSPRAQWPIRRAPTAGLPNRTRDSLSSAAFRACRTGTSTYFAGRRRFFDSPAARSLSHCKHATMASSSISVILPNFNHGRFLSCALEALLTQSVAPAEIIVIDDASTDDSVPIIKQIATRHRSITLLQNPHTFGVIKSLNRGIEHARGSYLYFAAADDWVVPGFFALATRMLEEHSEAGLFCGDAILVDGESNRICGYRPIVRPFYQLGFATAEDTKRLLRHFDNWMLTGSTVIRRDALLPAGGLDESLGSFADGYLLRRIALQKGFCYAPRIVAAWRIFPDSVSRQTSRDPARAIEFLATVPPRIAADPVFPDWYAKAFSDRWKFSVARVAMDARPGSYAIVNAIMSDSKFDIAMLRLIRLLLTPIPAIERCAILTFLTFRLHPYPLWRLVITALTRWLRPDPPENLRNTEQAPQKN